MKLRPLTLQICVFFCFCIIYLYTSLAEAASVIDIHRSVCRKDTLMKATDRNKKLTATASNIILQLHEKSLSRCTIKCVKNERCVSTNYKKNFANEEEKNCELLDVNKTSASITLSDENGWIHYEPVIQTGPRCRLVTCNAGFQCNETCQILAGYECVDVNECLSNPCQNGGTCSNQVNQYTCTCVAGYIETNCQTNFDECGSNPCQNGGTCIDGVNKYTCNCAAGYVGTLCQTNIDECASQPCQSFATCVDGVNKYTCQDTCTISPCLNGATCIPKATSYNCLCAPGYIGQKCGGSTSAKYTSCKQMRDATGWTANGVFTLWNKALTQRYNAYCHMSHGGWTLIARFSNKDTKNWMQTSGHYWYDQLATGDKTNPYTNADMINEAFYEAPGGQIKISKTDNPLTWIMYTVSSCFGGGTFRSKITSYGNFRNDAPWSIDACKGSCQVQAYSGASGVSGFSQYSCSSTIQASNYIGFWCHYSTGDGAVIMIGGGGSSCSRADHGIGVTEANSPQFGPPSASLDFGNDGQGTAVTSYGLNLWIK